MSETWYRYVDVQYAATPDEWDRVYGPGELKVELRKYSVVKQTPKGVWLAPQINGYVCSDRRFVLHESHKRFACSTLDLAKESFVARKKRQIAIHKTIANRAEKAIEIIEGKGLFL